MFCSHQDLMGENVFCESLAGEEIGRMKSWGNHPLSKAEHQLSSPTMMNDLPQTFMEPLLFKTACSRGTQARMSMEYLRHVQDADGVTTTCLDRLTGKESPSGRNTCSALMAAIPRWPNWKSCRSKDRWASAAR
jgi:2,4-dichlorophenol 6-monooxygenase